MNYSWTRSTVPGIALGFTVARLGFTDFDELHRMLLFRDLRLLLAFALAVSLTIIGFALLGRRLRMGSIHLHKGVIPGAVLFGIGWAITGACPGVVLAQIGQGLWPAFASLAGIIAGNWLAQRRQIIATATGTVLRTSSGPTAREESPN